MIDGLKVHVLRNCGVTTNLDSNNNSNAESVQKHLEIDQSLKELIYSLIIFLCVSKNALKIYKNKFNLYF